LIGAAAYVFATPENLVLPDKLWRFVWKDAFAAVPLYVWHLFAQSSFRREMGKRASGTSGSMKNISQDKVLKLKTILPPTDLQRKFAASVRQIECIRSAALEQLGTIDNVISSFQHHAFRGKV
jgi:type I restriction enzyme S subunit